VLLAVFAAAAGIAFARESGEPIVLTWHEGDVAGLTQILAADGRKVIGTLEYRQQRRGNMLEAVRRARFADGSSDEDRAQARVGKTLEGVGGRSTVRDAKGRAIVDVTIDVARGRISGFSNVDGERETYDEQVELPPGTYWGPLLPIVIRNFDRNASGDRLVFRSVLLTPKPRVLDLELTREVDTAIAKPGWRLSAVPFALKPTINALVDPIVQRLAPDAHFFVLAGRPPAIVGFSGPRNFAGQPVRIE
jgi:hypothetical protein